MSKCLVLLSSQPIFSTLEVMLRTILAGGLSSVTSAAGGAALANASSTSALASLASMSASAPTSLASSASSVSKGAKKEALGEQFPLERLLVWLRYAMPFPAFDGRPVRVFFLRLLCFNTCIVPRSLLS